MACTTTFIDFICDVLAPLGEVRSRKMMGDYVIYVNDKCVLTACDNTAYVKKLPCIDELMQNTETGRPYEGAKECYILDLSHPDVVRQAVATLWEHLPYPKAKTTRKPRRSSSHK